MFSPATDLPDTTMYQPQADYLPQLPSLIISTEDHQRTQTYELHHHHGHQYELANYCSYSSSGCESSPSSYSAVFPDETNKPIINAELTQRSFSSHSFPPMLNDNKEINHNMAFNYQPVANVMNLRSTHRLVDLMDSSSVRRVFSAGNFQMQQYQLSQQQHGLSSSKESSNSSIIEGMLSKACRYSPEEKKERIERYKTKRSHRNFNKKIKYACRKTLADSRPRIRGRFARNNSNDNNNEDDSLDGKWGGNKEHEADDQWESYQDDNWLDLFNAAWLLK